MEKELTELSLISLKRLYEKEREILNRRLLYGDSWEALSDQRWRVTQLAIILDKRLSSNSDPSSSKNRDHG